MIGLVLAGLLIRSSSTVSLTMTADVRKVVAALAAVSHRHIAVGSTVDATTLIVDVHAKPLTEVLQRVAWATYTRPVLTSGGWKLVDDPLARRAALAAYRKGVASEYATSNTTRAHEYLDQPFTIGQAKTLVQSMRGYPAELTEDFRNGDPDAALKKLQSLPRPANRALAHLLRSIEPSGWFSDSTPRVVYADEPTPVERRLPKALVAETVKQYDGDRMVLSEMANSTNTQPIRHVVLQIDVPDRPNEAWAMLTLFDGKDEFIDSASCKLLPDRTPPAPHPALLAPISTNERVVLSHDTIELFGRNLTPFPLRTAKMALDPVTFDPQASYKAEVWRAFGKRVHSDLVLNCDDRRIAYYDGWQTFPPMFRDAILELWGRGTKVETGWIISRPTARVPGASWQVSRPELKRAYVALQAMDAGSLDAAADLMYRSRLEFGMWNEWVLLRRLGLFRLSMQGHMLADLDALRLLGSMTLKQRHCWLTGGTVRGSELSAAAKQELVAYIYRTPRHVFVRKDDRYGLRNRADTIESLPSRVAPNGIDGAVLCIADDRMPEADFVYTDAKGARLRSSFGVHPHRMWPDPVPPNMMVAVFPYLDIRSLQAGC